MTVLGEIYKCAVCGNIVEVLHSGVGTLVCCGQPMNLLKEKTEDVGQEKHVPVIEKSRSGFKVKIGSVPHPMEKSHYIEWVAIVTENGIFRKFLKPGEKPQAEFKVSCKVLGAKEYCNIHGLWKAEKS